ncbi:hypothetical protein JY96_18830 [Aquabacterium sp. NJ1]|uniref:hypothetical protein n=1 Tax=Aquabacterium sp. NJ1 TaxID=1538295 RepID=UPI00052B9057|nr:hypothetical protein [Aquabacterium sp. NJ1]KGM41426.1 hypothetical protein JY96_18830 [Aquabacterium sp. NJ1]
MKRFSARLVLMAACALSLASASHARDRAATVTILDGQATLIHAATRLVVREGAAVEPEDIVETAPASALTRLEFDGGATLDLGPASRVMLRPSLASTGGSVLVYVLEGWAKLTLDKAREQGAVLLASAPVDVTGLSRDLVLHVKGNEAELFAESAPVMTQVMGKAGKPESVKVDKGAFLSRRGDGSVSVTPRPSPAFIQAVPRAFMDTLPSRLSLFKGKDTKLDAGPRLAYDDTQAWLNAEPRVRTHFLTRWKPLAQDEAFRRALVAQMALHPEWHKVLFPPPPPGRKPNQNPVISSEASKP